MPLYTLSKLSNERYYVTGDLTFLTLNKKTITTFDFLKSAKEICIDLAEVTTADSAGLALLIEWIKQSKLRGTTLSYNNIPQQLLTLSKLSGFEINEYCR